MTDFNTFLVVIVYTQMILIPILGLILLGLREERKRKELLLKECLKALRIVGVSRGRHLK